MKPLYSLEVNLSDTKINPMKKIIYPAIALAVVSLLAFIAISNWSVKPGATVKFTSGKVNGSFKGLKADIRFDKAHPGQSRISATIDANSISTGFFLKNSHAKDALGVDQYPTISFTATSVSKSGNGFEANGKLTMKGITKPATIYFTFDDKGNQGVFKGTLKVAPKNYGINRSGTPQLVTVYLTVPVSKSR
jgi:polyisoprenoid-binding protein YceI